MKMDEHARAWVHEFVATTLGAAALPPEQRNSVHWEIVSHVHEAAERRAEAHHGDRVSLADVQAVVDQLGGPTGIAAMFLQSRIVATPRAGPGKRIGAYLIDVVLLWFLVGMMFGMLEFFVVLGGGFGGFFAALFYAGLGLGLPYLYFVVAELRFGASLGKTALKLRTVMADGRPVTLEAALVRNVAKVFPPLLLFDVFLYLVALRKDDQRLSDRLANTIVIDASRPVMGPAPPAPIPPPVPAVPPTALRAWEKVE